MELTDFDTYRSFVFSLLYTSYDARDVFEKHVELAKQFEEPLLAGIPAHTNDKTPNRRLKIGYVSPDFRRHSVAYFIEGVLASHNRDHFEIFCYSLISYEDDVTTRMRSVADHWENVADMDYDHVAELIRKDGIDILVDLAGHMYKHLLLFARKPAPVQVSWIGYPATTGFRSVDYKIVDGYTDPPGMTEEFYSEKLLRMPDCFLCYTPEENTPEVSALPALTSEEVTFGSFNNLAKLTPEVVALWSKILQSVPDSFLNLKAARTDRSTTERVKGMFAKNGIDFGQLELIPFTPSFRGHLETYHTIDIALDPFPYNGVTTTCEALWMGVPVITLEGNAHVSRVGGSLLSAVGLKEFIAGSHEQYIETAVKLAGDLERLKSLRKSLRDMMKHSSLCDARRFTENLEASYRRVWEGWCASV